MKEAPGTVVLQRSEGRRVDPGGRRGQAQAREAVTV